MKTLLDQYGQPFDTITCADNPEIARLRSLVVDLALTTRALTKKDIATWRQAWQMAITHNNPRRGELYNVYADIEIDGHLSGAITQINNSVMQRSFKITDRKTRKEKPELTELLEAGWFKDFMRLSLEERYWGPTLIQLGDVISVFGKMKFQNVELVPRHHVIPEFGVIVRDAISHNNKGIPYRQGKIAKWVIEVGNPRGLGLYLKVAPHVISKKNMLAFWDQFGELFGHPIRIAKTSNPDPKERSRVEKMLTQMGAAAWGLFPEGTDIDLKESSRGDAFEVYDRRVVRANSEMSKTLLTVTMTMDDGSSLSQSQVHEKMFKQTVEAEADRLRDIINNQLIPRMAEKGFPFGENDLFEWNYALEYSPEQMNELEKNVLGSYEVDPQYWIDNYGIPVLGPKTSQPALKLKADDLDFFV